MKRHGLMGWATCGAAAMAGWAFAADPAATTPSPMVTVKALQNTIQPGGTVTVDVFVSGALNVGAYQIQLGATGGSRGTLTLEQMAVNKQRPDFAYYQAGSELIDLQDKHHEWLGIVRMAGASDLVKPSYVGTFTFRASLDAAGVFQINVRSDSTETFLLAENGVLIPHRVGAAAEVGVGTPAPVRAEQRKG